MSVAVARPSLRGFTHTLIFGGLCIATAWAMHNFHSVLLRQSEDAVARRPILSQLIEVMHVSPTVYDKEAAMTPSELLGRWDGAITEASERFHVPKAWIRAVMRQESGGRTMLGENQPIVSHAGAVGLMQVLPETYEEMAAEHKLGANPFNARDNIMAGAAYLRWLHQKYGYPAMFAAYNAGPGKLEDHLEHGARLPAETRAYVGGITKALHADKTDKSGLDLVRFTRPDGALLKIDPGQVKAVRAPWPGEYA
ncbi:MAG TPA: lytic transglycosylase domain-containing protein, partial [Rhizomicrobium sp.]|nr:lytic transglycosylase domain-containing protein [Rhizomicrobium sp.]